MKYLFSLLATLVALGSQCQSISEIQTQTIEVVSFRLKEGVSEQEASKKLASLGELINHYEGFISRKLSVDANGNWIDIVYWTSKTLALQAAESVATNKKAMEVFALIDESSMSMNHYEVISSFKSSSK